MPVLFASVINAAIDDGYRIFLEVSSHSIDAHSIHESLMDVDVSYGVVLPTLLRNVDSQRNILFTLSILYCMGEHVNHGSILPDRW